jgi:hypothetical protein
LKKSQVLLAAGLFCCAAFAQTAKPNFAGVWKLNNGKSTPAGAADRIYTVTIEQSKNNITVATKAEGVTNILDGAFPTTGKIRTEKLEKKYRFTRVVWEGPTLVFEIADKDSKKETAHLLFFLRESWSLSPDGKVMTTFRRTAENKQVADQKSVFDKQ